MSKPTSRVKLRACRLNGARSRGPVTEAGKRRSSQNGLGLGAYSNQILLPGESPEDFAAHYHSILDTFHPATDEERYVTQRIAITSWRRNRLEAAEHRTLNQNLPPIEQIWNQEIPEDEILDPNRLTHDVDNSPETRLLKAYAAASEVRGFRGLSDHAAREQNTLYRLYTRLLRLKAARAKAFLFDPNPINDSFTSSPNPTTKKT
jgi:hypothetical protein